MTLSQLLLEVNTAISQVLINQEYTINGRSYKRADLESLRKWRREINEEIREFGARSTGVSDADNVTEAYVMFT